jgi:hypothetical protein
MTVRFGLWDVESGNSLGFYPTLVAALATVRRELRQYGREAVATLALDVDDGKGGGGLVAEGVGLLALAQRREARKPASRALVYGHLRLVNGSGRPRTLALARRASGDAIIARRIGRVARRDKEVTPLDQIAK